ncbi:hypothetical protein [Hymenobacter sp. GOD-10R]|uniref:hypothetical protein n=1 Tax=Hymenobacter sp. GOD-10R TaxID=3093922 RepID=UPI002D7877A3|nr:hypothetical protein [Hymenobacter sp. GOD-10R]WRQ29155.1 hypothetical protein SD425_02615 [Hymenobacter sp. GOD-10R]
MNNLDAKAFLFELPIYTPIKITDENRSDFNKLISFRGNIDYFNPGLGENTTYNITIAYSVHVSEFTSYGGLGSAIAKCVRTSQEFTFYYFYDDENRVFMKVGQHPSVAYFHISQVKQYNKILSRDKLKEFTRAIGLAANGVGIGSFVYLRRIFEGLIEEAHTIAKADQGWDEEPYSRARMADKIELLRAHLPAFLVENKALYGILSVGVHALKEEDCLAYFETVKVGIELILDEKLEAFEKQKKIDDAKQKLADLTNKINAGSKLK